MSETAPPESPESPEPPESPAPPEKKTATPTTPVGPRSVSTAPAAASGPEPSARPPLWNLPAAVAAWVLPGLGHLMTGEVKRGLVLATAIGTLWMGGVLVGGIGVIEAKTGGGQVRPWFLGQMMIAPSLLVEYTHDRYRSQSAGQEPEPDPDGETLYEPSYGRPHEIGTLYTALAGLLNLLAIIDVVYREPGKRKRGG